MIKYRAEIVINRPPEAVFPFLAEPARQGAWMDMAQVLGGKPGIEQKSCKDKVSLYMQGAVGIRPIIDLNSYYVLVMDAGPEISVVDPVVSRTLALVSRKNAHVSPAAQALYDMIAKRASGPVSG